MDENRIPRNCNLMGKGDETIKIEGTVFSEKPMRFACPISKNTFLWVYDVGIIFWYIKHIDCMWYFISMGDSGSRVSPMSSVENRDATNIVHNRQSNNSDPSARSGDACRNTSGRRWCVGMGLFQELFPPIPAHGVSSCLSLYKGPVWVWGVIDGYSQYSACKNRVHCPYRHIVGTSPELHVHTGEWSHSLHPWVLHPWVVTGQWALAKFLRFGA